MKPSFVTKPQRTPPFRPDDGGGAQSAAQPSPQAQAAAQPQGIVNNNAIDLASLVKGLFPHGVVPEVFKAAVNRIAMKQNIIRSISPMNKEYLEERITTTEWNGSWNSFQWFVVTYQQQARKSAFRVYICAEGYKVNRMSLKAFMFQVLEKKTPNVARTKANRDPWYGASEVEKEMKQALNGSKHLKWGYRSKFVRQMLGLAALETDPPAASKTASSLDVSISPSGANALENDTTVSPFDTLVSDTSASPLAASGADTLGADTSGTTTGTDTLGTTTTENHVVQRMPRTKPTAAHETMNVKEFKLVIERDVLKRNLKELSEKLKTIQGRQTSTNSSQGAISAVKSGAEVLERRLAKIERDLKQLGYLSQHHIIGATYAAETLEQKLGTIEFDSKRSGNTGGELGGDGKGTASNHRHVARSSNGGNATQSSNGGNNECDRYAVVSPNGGNNDRHGAPSSNGGNNDRHSFGGGYNGRHATPSFNGGNNDRYVTLSSNGGNNDRHSFVGGNNDQYSVGGGNSDRYIRNNGRSLPNDDRYMAHNGHYMQNNNGRMQINNGYYMQNNNGYYMQNNNGYYTPSNGGSTGGWMPNNGGNNGVCMPNNGGNTGGWVPNNGGNNGGSFMPNNGGNNGGYMPSNGAINERNNKRNNDDMVRELLNRNRLLLRELDSQRDQQTSKRWWLPSFWGSSSQNQHPAQTNHGQQPPPNHENTPLRAPPQDPPGDYSSQQQVVRSHAGQKRERSQNNLPRKKPSGRHL